MSTNESFLLLHFRNSYSGASRDARDRQMEAVLQLHLVCMQLCQLDAEISSCKQDISIYKY